MTVLDGRCARLKARLKGLEFPSPTPLRVVPTRRPLWYRERYGGLNDVRHWSRSVTLAMSNTQCEICSGSGMVTARKPCRCALRNIFLVCLRRYLFIQSDQMRYSSYASLTGDTAASGPINKVRSSRPNEDYCADFISITRRSLTPIQWRLFQTHLLQGVPWNKCCKKFGLKLEETPFFRIIHSMESRLGRIYYELRPYNLFPLDGYFDDIMLEELHGSVVEFPHAWSKAA